MDTYRFASRIPQAASVVSHSRSFRDRAAERGIALVMTLLILSMVMALSVGMVIAMSSETLIGGYYRNYRSSFYAADSGANIAIQYAENQLVAGVPATWASPPIANPATLASNVQTAVLTAYGASTSLNAGNGTTSWPESFKVTNVSVSQLGTATPTSYNQTVCNAAGPPVNGYAYQFQYSVTAVGSAQGSEQQTVTESGIINMGLTGQATTTCVSFAYFGAFIDAYQGGIGPLVPGTMTGPMFTNTAWEFMPSIPPWTSPYIFTDPVGQVGSQVYYWNTSWGYNLSSASSYGSGANLVAPDFEQGLFLNQPRVNPPTNSFNQVEAVVDGYGNGQGAYWSGLAGSTSPSAALTGGAQTIQLTNPTGQTYTNTTSSGVYFNKGTASASGSNPVGTNGVCPATAPPPCIAGGGFYIEGNADVELIPVASSSTAQEYVITQNGVTTTIVTDPAANGGVGTTTITQGTTVQTLNGVPMNNVTAQASAMVYVDGTVTIHGPGEGQGAVQDNTMINVTANGDIVATQDVLYKTEPVTIPQDALIPAVANMNQVLGLYTAVGNFITDSNNPDNNIEVDGSIATISSSDVANNCASGKGGQLSDVFINTFNNVGGMIQSCIYAADIDTENTWFDRRFTQRPNFAPPWFPSTQITQGGPLSTNVAPSIQRTQWLSTSSQ